MKAIDTQSQYKEEKDERDKYLRDNGLCMFARKGICYDMTFEKVDVKKRDYFFFPWLERIVKVEKAVYKPVTGWNCQFEIDTIFQRAKGQPISINTVYQYDRPCTTEDSKNCEELKVGTNG